MRLKILTTAFLIFGLALLLSWPWTVGKKPPAGSPRGELLVYARRIFYYTGGTIIVFSLTAVFAVLWARQTRRELSEEAKRNINELLEGTLKDHERQKQ
jgi:hypothetical protein